MSQGSSGNPGDKPYEVITLNENDDLATVQLQNALAAGLKVLFFDGNRAIVGNYKGN